MSPYKIHLSLAVVLAVTACLPQRVHAQYWTNGQAASFVIGQTGFGANISNLTSTGMTMPYTVVVDPATGKVFVSDYGNNRVLRYPSIAAMTNGAAAEAVLGQPNFTTTALSYAIPATATTFSEPEGLAVDGAGNLWVVDQYNARVLRFANAATIASGAAASGVLGWPNLVSNSITYNGNIEPATAASMYFPNAVFCKGTTLWVSDNGNNRILRFDNAASLANGANADAFFGTSTQGDEASGSYQLWGPNQIYVDGSDNLWVADGSNNRVMMFPNASTGGNNSLNLNIGAAGVEATLVLGQTNFGNNSPGTTASTMSSPYGVYGDPAGNIYVGDLGNNRILVFANAAHLSNGAAATWVLGQTDFVSNGTGDGASQLNGPALLFIPTSGTYLMAADAFNNRVLTYIPLVPLPLTLTSFTGRLQSNGQVLLQWQVSDQGAPGPGNAGSVELEYSTTDSTGFTDVLNTQSVRPAVSNYSYVQVSPAPGVNYYRLKLVAPDGSSTYSPIVSAIVGISGGTGSTGLTIYPNPARNSVVITVPQAGGATAMGSTAGWAASTAEIGIYSSTGMLMQRLVTGATVNTIDISRLAAGLYTVRVTEGGMATTGNFVKINE
jgi:sugar lactone lactonase YvrE